MSTTVVTPGGLEVSSNHESAESMLQSVAEPAADAKTPRVLIDKGEPVEDTDEKDETSQAASVLGKKGGKAAAKARVAAEKAKPVDDKVTPEKGKAEPEGDEDEPDAKAKAAEAKKGNPRHDPEARIGVLAREKKEAQERADRAERELAEVRRAPPRQDAPPAPAERREAQPARPAPDDDPEPAEADFENYADYVKAAGRHAARQEFREQEQRSQERQRFRQHVDEIHGHVQSFQERVTGLKRDDPGLGDKFQEFISGLPDDLVSNLTTSVQLPANVQSGPKNLLADKIVMSPKSREILEFFADNMDEFQRIAALQTRDEVVAGVAIIEHRLDAVTADTSSRREVSKAGSPVRSVAGSPHTAEPDLFADMDLDRYVERSRRARNS